MSQTITNQIGEQDRHPLDRRLNQLQSKKESWANLSLIAKVELLQLLRHNLAKEAGRWVTTVNEARQIAPHAPWAAEEWYEIFTVARALRGYAESLDRLARGEEPALKRVWARPDGQLVARVFPGNIYDWLLFNGISGEVWMQPDVTTRTLPRQIGAFYRRRHPSGGVALVLGAGNVNSIPMLDVLDRLFVRGRVVLLKLSPVNAYLRSVFEAILLPLIAGGFVAIVEGGAAAGAYLAHHADVDEIHVTGGRDTYHALLYGSGVAGRKREVVLRKPITAELGGVTPVIVLPGRWSQADIRFQAENIATMKLYNSGFNCIAAQLLILPEQWPQRQQLVDAIRQVMGSLPPMHAYYPGAAQRQQTVARLCDNVVTLGGDVPRTLIPEVAAPEAAVHCTTKEFFGPTLAVTTLPGETAVSFLNNAVTFCNELVSGTLGVDLIVSPNVQRMERDAVETAVAALRYGAVGVNVWCGVGYRLVEAPWGAFQDPDATDIGSGNDVVHNTLLFDRPQKTVVRGRFRPFPRSWLHGDPAFLPRPPWFVTHRQRRQTARRVAHFAMDPHVARLPGIFAAALRG